MDNITTYKEDSRWIKEQTGEGTHGLEMKLEFSGAWVMR
jgi:hypothetical protein